MNESEMLMFNNGNWNAKDEEIPSKLILWQMKKEAEIQHFQNPGNCDDKIKMLVCITMYNESFSQFL